MLRPLALRLDLLLLAPFDLVPGRGLGRQGLRLGVGEARRAERTERHDPGCQVKSSLAGSRLCVSIGHVSALAGCCGPIAGGSLRYPDAKPACSVSVQSHPIFLPTRDFGRTSPPTFCGRATA